MANFNANCPACDSVVPAGHSTCSVCGCPEGATSQIIDEYSDKHANPERTRVMSAFQCQKCNGQEYVTGEIRAEGGWLSSAFEISTKKFKHVSCKSCGYTEFYRADLSTGAKIFDLFAG